LTARQTGAPNVNAVQSALVAQFKAPMITAGFVKFVNSTLQFLPSILLNLLLDRIADRAQSNPDHALWEAYVIAASLFIALSVRTMVENNYFHRVIRVGWQIRSVLTTAVYRKALRMSPVARQDTPTGQIVTLMQIDANRLDTLMSQVGDCRLLRETEHGERGGVVWHNRASALLFLARWCSCT